MLHTVAQLLGCLYSQEDFFEGNNAQQKVGVAIMEQSIMSGNYMTAPSII
jgi:hypothetical protein